MNYDFEPIPDGHTSDDEIFIKGELSKLKAFLTPDPSLHTNENQLEIYESLTEELAVLYAKTHSPEEPLESKKMMDELRSYGLSGGSNSGYEEKERVSILLSSYLYANNLSIDEKVIPDAKNNDLPETPNNTYRFLARTLLSGCSGGVSVYAAIELVTHQADNGGFSPVESLYKGSMTALSVVAAIVAYKASKSAGRSTEDTVESIHQAGVLKTASIYQLLYTSDKVARIWKSTFNETQ